MRPTTLCFTTKLGSNALEAIRTQVLTVVPADRIKPINHSITVADLTDEEYTRMLALNLPKFTSRNFRPI